MGFMRAPWLLSLALVTACGKVSHRAADASPGAPDSGPDASLRGTVTVLALSPSGDGSPAAVVPVVFTDPDGTMVAEVMTDAQGMAQADVLPGATVTAVFSNTGGGSGALLGTVMAVNPGDHIQIGFKNNTPINALGNMTINFPALAGATNYLVYNSCTSSSTTGTSVTVSFNSRCQKDTYDIMVVAEDGSGNVLQVATLNGAAFNDGGTLNVPNNYQGGGTMQFQFDNVPAAITGISASRTNLSQGRTLFGQPATITITQGTGTGSITRLAGGDQAQVTAAFQTGSPIIHELFERVPASAATYTLDVTSDVLPVLQAPTYNKSKGRIDWTAADGGSQADALIAIAQYQRTMPTAQNFQWFMVGPGSLTAVTLPTLPDDLASDMPTTGDSLGMGVFLVNTADIDTYDDDRDTIYPDIERIVDGGYDSDRIDWTGGYGTNITL